MAKMVRGEGIGASSGTSESGHDASPRVGPAPPRRTSRTVTPSANATKLSSTTSPAIGASPSGALMVASFTGRSLPSGSARALSGAGRADQALSGFDVSHGQPECLRLADQIEFQPA